MIEATNIAFSYRSSPVLRGIDLRFEPGKLYAIIGPNGSGKTTLIKLLSRLAKPREGCLFLDGTPYDCCERKTFAKQVALLPQGRNTPNISVLDLVSCARYPYLGLSRQLTEADRLAVRTAMEVTHTEQFAFKNVKTLSGGERQRVYLAMLYAQDSPYVLLDEPTTHLDISSGFQIMELLEEMKSSGKCVVAVLHELSLALRYADEIVLLHKGEAIFNGNPQTLVSSGSLEAVFHVRCTPVTLQGKTEYCFTADQTGQLLTAR